MLSVISQTQRDSCLIPFIGGHKNRSIIGTQDQIEIVGLVKKRIGSSCLMVQNNVLEIIRLYRNSEMDSGDVAL